MFLPLVSIAENKPSAYFLPSIPENAKKIGASIAENKPQAYFLPNAKHIPANATYSN